MKTLEFKLTLTLAQQQTIDLWLDQLRWIWNESLSLLEEDQQRKWREKNPVEGDLDAVAWYWHRNENVTQNIRVKANSKKTTAIGSGKIKPLKDGDKSSEQAEAVEAAPEGKNPSQSFCELQYGLACECATYNRKDETLYPVCRLRTKRDCNNPGKHFWKPATNDATPDKPWLHEICSRVRLGVTDSLLKAWKAYKDPKHPGRKPQYKGKRDKLRSLTNKNGKTTVKFARVNGSDNAYVKFPRLGTAIVKGFYKRYQGQEYSVVRVVKEPSGYYLQLVCEIDSAQIKPSDKAVGLDFGLKSVFTTDSGRSIPPPKLYRQKQKRLRRLQRKASRQINGSSSQKQTYKKIAALHEKIRRSRNAFNHKLSTSLVREFGAIAVEDIQIKNLVRRPKPKKREDGKGYEHNGAKRKSGMNKSFADTALGDLKKKIEDKTKAWGREIVLVAPHYTTIDCSRCGEKVRKALSTRTHRCPSCFLVMDRDKNAARNILAKANFKRIYRTLVREVKRPQEGEMPSISEQSGEQVEAAMAAPEHKNCSQSLIDDECGGGDVNSSLPARLSGNLDKALLSSSQEETTIRDPYGERPSPNSGSRRGKRKRTTAPTSALDRSESYIQLSLWDSTAETG